MDSLLQKVEVGMQARLTVDLIIIWLEEKQMPFVMPTRSKSRKSTGVLDTPQV